MRPFLVFVLALAPQVSRAQGSVTVTVGADGPVVSPDGRTVAVSILGKVFLVPIDGGNARQVSGPPGWDIQPAFSPDGKSLAFAHTRPGSVELMIADLTTGQARPVWRDESASWTDLAFILTMLDVQFHPSEPKIFVERSQYSIWSIDLATGRTHRLDRWGGTSFAVSPDGHQLAQDRVQGPSHFLTIRAFDSAGMLDSTSMPPLDPPSATRVQFEARWSVDGRSLIYVEREEGMESVVIRDGATGSTRRVFTSPFDNKQFAVHPDGKTLVLAAGRKLYRVDLTTGRRTAIQFKATFVLANPAPGRLAITNARLFDAITGHVRDSATVELSQGKISRVVVGPYSGAKGVRVIDARGRFLMPGLMDNHFHTFAWAARGRGLEEALKLGVTAARDAGGMSLNNLNLRDAIEVGLIEGPTLYSMSTLVDAPTPANPRLSIVLTDPKAAPTLAPALRAVGFDGIKLYASLAPAPLRALVKAANRRGILVTGDVSLITWSDAVEAGVNGLNHICNYRWGFLPDSLKGLGRDGIGRVLRATIEPDWNELRAVFRRMAKKQVALDPTIRACGITGPDLDSAQRASLSGDALAVAERNARIVSRVLVEAFNAGVSVLAGTDGPYLVEELEVYQRAGVPNARILQSATINGARWLRQEKELGSIAVGRRADLVLVNGDPLADISALRKLAMVIKGGRVVVDNDPNR